MNKKEKGRVRFIQRSVCLLAGVFLLTSFGCQPLKRKFTRKKKHDKEDKFIPVLDPIDYPPVHHSNEDRYRYNYSIWQVWEKDLIQTIVQDGSDKRLKYLVGQCIIHLTEMHRMITQEKQAELGKIINEFELILKEFHKQKVMRDDHLIRRRIERAAKKVRNEYKPKLMVEYYASEDN